MFPKRKCAYNMPYVLGPGWLEAIVCGGLWLVLRGTDRHRRHCQDNGLRLQWHPVGENFPKHQLHRRIQGCHKIAVMSKLLWLLWGVHVALAPLRWYPIVTEILCSNFRLRLEMLISFSLIRGMQVHEQLILHCNPQLLPLLFRR